MFKLEINKCSLIKITKTNLSINKRKIIPIQTCCITKVQISEIKNTKKLSRRAQIEGLNQVLTSRVLRKIQDIIIAIEAETVSK